jgi:hypothetical protein
VLGAAEVDMLTLKQAGLVAEMAKVVKVIKTGELTKAVKLNGHRRDRRCQGCHRSGRRQRGLIFLLKDNSVATSAAQMAKTGKFGDLRRRWCFLLLALVVYRIGAHIPVPGIDPAQLQQLFKGQQGGILSLFNMFSGGALSRFTVFALGIMPYISASIIMQLLTYVLPTFEQLKKEGEAGRRKITQYTRYGTLGLAMFQSLGIAVALESSAGLVIARAWVSA